MKNKEKFAKENKEFVDEVIVLKVSDLEARLAKCAMDAHAVEEAKNADEGLATARETASGLAAPYRDAKKLLKLKSDYIAELINTRTGK